MKITSELRKLVERWREGAGPGSGDYSTGMDSAFDTAADDLEGAIINLEAALSVEPD